MNEIKIENVIMKTEIYETPKCEVMNLDSEGTILVGSDETGSASHDRFGEDNYDW